MYTDKLCDYKRCKNYKLRLYKNCHVHTKMLNKIFKSKILATTLLILSITFVSGTVYYIDNNVNLSEYWILLSENFKYFTEILSENFKYFTEILSENDMYNILSGYFNVEITNIYHYLHDLFYKISTNFSLFFYKIYIKIQHFSIELVNENINELTCNDFNDLTCSNF